MATGLSIINRALSIIAMLGEGESPSADTLSDSLDTLNALVDELKIIGLMNYAKQTEPFTTTGNTNSYTIGPSGVWVTNRPIEVLGAYIRDNGVDYPIKVAEFEFYNNVASKSITTTYPEWLYYKPDVPNGTIYLWPTPLVSKPIYVETNVQMASFTTVNTDIPLPPGYSNMLAYNLAVDLASLFNVPLEVKEYQRAEHLMQLVQRANRRPIVRDVEVAAKRRYNIYRDY